MTEKIKKCQCDSIKKLKEENKRLKKIIEELKNERKAFLMFIGEKI